MLRHDRQGVRKLVGAGTRTRVVEGRDEVSLGSRPHPLDDEIPVGVQVRQADGGVIMPQRCAQDRRDGELGGDTGNDLDVDAVGAHLQGRRRHGVDSWVAAADKGDVATVAGRVDGSLGAFLLGAHLGGQDRGPRTHQVADLTDVGGVSGDEGGAADGLGSTWGEKVARARPKADDRKVAAGRDTTDGAGGLRGLGLVDQQFSSLAQHRRLADTRSTDLTGDDVRGRRNLLRGQGLCRLGAVFDTELVGQLHQTELTSLDLVGDQSGDGPEGQAVLLQGLRQQLSQRLHLGALVASHPDDQAVRVQDDGGQVVTMIGEHTFGDPLGDDDSGDRGFSVLGDVLG